MEAIRLPMVILMFAALWTAGCAKPPVDKIEEAEKAVKEARESGANLYAPDEYAKLEGTLAALKQEVADQQKQFVLFQDYGKAEQLAASTASDAARIKVESIRKKEEAKTVALQAQKVAQEAVSSTLQLIAQAPVGKDRSALESIKNDAEALKASLAEVQAAMDREDYSAAQAQAKAIDEKSRTISAEVQAARDKVKRGKSSSSGRK